MNRLSRLLAVAVPLALPAQSPWSRVPAPPTTCYWDSAFSASVSATKTQLDAEVRRQDSINDVAAKAVNGQEGGSRMAAMQAAMMKDPAGAQKVLQSIADMGTEEYQNAQMKVLNRQAELEGSYPGLDSAYKTALGKAVDPVMADWHKRGDGEGSKAATPAELAAIKKRYADAYAPVCTQYFQAGKFPQWLATYKDFFVREYIPQNDKTFTTTKDMLTFYGANTANYKSTNSLKAVASYLGFVYKAYNARVGVPRFE